MTQFALNGVLDREATRLLAAELREAIDCGTTILLAAGAVEQIGTAGLQLLISARRSAVTGDADVRLVDPSPALIRTVAAAGLSDCLDLVRESCDDA